MLNKEEFDFLGITKFHEAGYKGQGIVVASIENGRTQHSKKVENILKQILPEATIVSNIKYWKEVPEDLDGYTCSQLRAGSENPEKVAKAKELYAKNVFMTCGIGNDDIENYSDLAKYEEWVSVGACKFNDGKPKLEYYSSKSEFLDFVALTNMKTDLGRFTGTSCATPVLQGMAMLVQNFFIDKTGKKLTNEKLIKFIKDNCIDLEEEGHDIKTGHGLFILPDSKTIQIKKYMEDYMENKKIVLKIDSNIVTVNGVERGLDAPATIINNRTMVPIRFVAEELGCKVSWNEEKRTVIIEN